MGGTRHATEDKTQQSKDSVSSQLIFDINGPFVLHLVGEEIKIHAPICPDHYGNLLTDTNDFPLSGLTIAAPSKKQSGRGWVYELSEVPKSTNKCDCKPNGLLKVTHPLAMISETNCSFVFIAPRPDEIVALHPEPIWIHQNDAKRFVDDMAKTKEPIVNDPRARGLRLIYRHCNVDPVVKTKHHPKRKKPLEFEKLRCGTIGLNPAYRSMTLRFAANHATSDEHHEDAYNCFQNMRALVSISDPKQWDIDKWRVDFCNQDDQYQIENKTGKHPSDCGALALVVQS